MTTVGEQKRALRATVLQQRNLIDVALRKQRGDDACERLFAQVAAWKTERATDGTTTPFVLALYDSMGSEVPTGRLLELTLDAGWAACLPVLSSPTAQSDNPKRIMSFVMITRENVASARELFLGSPLRTVALDQLARADIPTVAIEAIDAFVVPLVAFDDQNRRLGYGGGYYDAVLSRVAAGLKDASDQQTHNQRADNRAPFVSGLAFAEQRVEQVPAEPHDIPLPRILIA